MNKYKLALWLTILVNQAYAQKSDTAFFPFQDLSLYNAISEDSVFIDYGKALNNCSSLKILDLDLDKISRSKLVYDICIFPNIEILAINGFYHPTFNKNCDTDLKMIVLGNFVNNINQVITLLENTTYIDLTNNTIPELKRKHTELLSKAEAFRFANNGTKFITFKNRTIFNLLSLDISGNNLKNIPKNLENLEKLVYLDISFNKSIKYIDPKRIKKLKKLKTLVIEGIDLQEKNLNELKQLPLNLVLERK